MYQFDFEDTDLGEWVQGYFGWTKITVMASSPDEAGEVAESIMLGRIRAKAATMTAAAAIRRYDNVRAAVSQALDVGAVKFVEYAVA